MPSFLIKAIATSLHSIGHVSSVTYRAFRRPRSCGPCSPRYFLRASAQKDSVPSSSGTSRATNNWSLLDFSEEFCLVDLHRMGSEIRYGNTYSPIFRGLTSGGYRRYPVGQNLGTSHSHPQLAEGSQGLAGETRQHLLGSPPHAILPDVCVSPRLLRRPCLIIESGWDGSGFTRLHRIVTTGVRDASSSIVVSAQVPLCSTVRCSSRKHTTSSTNFSLIPDPSITRSNCL
jgi:hypothetical protein